MRHLRRRHPTTALGGGEVKALRPVDANVERRGIDTDAEQRDIDVNAERRRRMKRRKSDGGR